MDATPAQLIAWVSEARQRTLQLIADLDDDQLLGPRLEIVNPLLWEIGHVAWFQEKWVLRRGGEPPIRPDADDLYDSAAVAHDRRWELPLPDREDTLRYMSGVLERVLDRCGEQDPEDAYFVLLAGASQPARRRGGTQLRARPWVGQAKTAGPDCRSAGARPVRGEPKEGRGRRLSCSGPIRPSPSARERVHPPQAQNHRRRLPRRRRSVGIGP